MTLLPCPSFPRYHPIHTHHSSTPRYKNTINVLHYQCPQGLTFHVSGHTLLWLSIPKFNIFDCFPATSRVTAFLESSDVIDIPGETASGHWWRKASFLLDSTLLGSSVGAPASVRGTPTATMGALSGYASFTPSSFSSDRPFIAFPPSSSSSPPPLPDLPSWSDAVDMTLTRYSRLPQSSSTSSPVSSSHRKGAERSLSVLSMISTSRFARDGREGSSSRNPNQLLAERRWY